MLWLNFSLTSQITQFATEWASHVPVLELHRKAAEEGGVRSWGARYDPNEVNQGREFDLIRLRIEDKRTAYFAGPIEESRNSAGLRAPRRIEAPF